MLCIVCGDSMTNATEIEERGLLWADSKDPAPALLTAYAAVRYCTCLNSGRRVPYDIEFN